MEDCIEELIFFLLLLKSHSSLQIIDCVDRVFIYINKKQKIIKKEDLKMKENYVVSIVAFVISLVCILLGVLFLP